MKHVEMLASFSLVSLGGRAQGLAVAACVLLIGGYVIWRVSRFLKKDNDEELEREHHG